MKTSAASSPTDNSPGMIISTTSTPAGGLHIPPTTRLLGRVTSDRGLTFFVHNAPLSSGGAQSAGRVIVW